MIPFPFSKAVFVQLSEAANICTSLYRKA